jgi:siroheme synthase
MYQKSLEAGLGNPAVMVIGEVVGLHLEYAGRFDNKFAMENKK